jgi:hypothetical protein
MDVDGDEDALSRPRRVQDFGIEVDFSGITDEEREVNFSGALLEHLLSNSRIVHQRD